MDHARNVVMICKEVFTNICKHAQCTKVNMEAVLVGRNTVQLFIKDNGKSFNTDTSYNGNGLVNIRQRVHYLGADMQLHSATGSGTSLAFRFFVSAVRPQKTNQ
jgi:signal transduction histidine kinase